MERQYFVYIMSSGSRTLYTGVTNNLIRRTAEHKSGAVPGSTRTHKTQRLVYAESFTDIRIALSREKQVKSWCRSKKIALIEAINPMWKDLAESWFPELGLVANPSLCSG